MSGGHQSRPFSPYRHAPTQEDLLNAAVRGRALAIPEEPEKERSVASTSPSKMPSRQSKVLSHIEEGKPLSQLSAAKQSSAVASHTPRPSRVERDHDATPTPSRRHSPEAMDDEEVRIVNDALAAQTPRTSIYAAPLEPEITSHYHDMELCILLHQENDPAQHEIVKKALRKAVRQRVKKLGMKYDNEVCSWPLNQNEDIVYPFGSRYDNIERHIMIMIRVYTFAQTTCLRYAVNYCDQFIKLMRARNHRNGRLISNGRLCSCSNASSLWVLRLRD